MSTRITDNKEVKLNELLGTVAAVAAGGGLLAGLGKWFWGNKKGTPEQLAQLRSGVVAVRRYISNITNVYSNIANQYDNFGIDIAARLKEFQKQVEQAYVSNDQKKIATAVKQAATVAAYTTAFPALIEDIINYRESHEEEEADPAQRQKILDGINKLIVRSLTAVNVNKLGGLAKQLTLLGINMLPAPAGLTPKDFAKSYTDALAAQYAAEEGASSNIKTGTPTEPYTDSGRTAPVSALAELRKATNEVQLATLKEFSACYSNTRKQLLAEAKDDKFAQTLNALKQGITNANSSAVAAGKQAAAQADPQAGQPSPGQLTPDQAKKIQSMLQSVSSVIGRLTPAQKQQFSTLLQQLKSVIG